MRKRVVILLVLAGVCVTAKALCPQFEPGLQVGTVAHYWLDEISGMAASRQNSDVLWVHNDAGNDPRVFAMNRDGTHLGIYNLSGAVNYDWEDIAIGPGPVGGVDYLYVGDIGDSGSRTNIRVFRVAEPAVDSQQAPIETTLTGVDTITLAYPDGARNAEALMVDPATKDIYVISKENSYARVYRAPYPQSTTTPITMEYKCQFLWQEASGADISLNGDMIIVRNDDGDASVWLRPAGTNLWDAFSGTECAVQLLWEPNGEAICFDADGWGYYATSEEAYQPIYYYASVNSNLSVTEIMVQSAQVSAQGDWWELTNTGPSSVDLTGYSWDNSDQVPGTNVFGDVTIAPGERIIVLDAYDSGGVNTWKSLWELGNEVNVYRFSFMDSEFSNEDGLFLYNTSDVLVTSVTYTIAAYGASNEWDTSGTFLGISVIGENGAYQSSGGDIGSPGYAVDNTQSPCTTLAGMVYWTDRDAQKIQRVNYTCGGVEDLLTAADGLIDPRGISLDLTSRKMYWADNGTNKIHRADLDGSNIEDVVSGLVYPADIALDLSDGKVYWADTDAGKIQRKNLDGTGSIEDVITSITQPYYLTLDVVNGKIYWSDFDSPVIHRANFDGSGVEDFITGLDRVRDIALDVTGGKIYWGDRDTSKVQRANLDGTGIEDLFGPTDGLDRPHGLALDTAIGKMFWTDTTTDTVYMANTDGSGSAESLATGLIGPWGIAIISTRQIIHVDADAPGPVHDGLNWHDAYLYLQDGLDAAASGDEIRVAQGIYKPDQGIGQAAGDRNISFQLENGVAMKGGYAGYGEADPNERNIDVYESILSGDLGSNDANVADACDLLGEPTRSENSYHVITGRDIDETTILDGFAIIAGNANGPDNSGLDRGGGMFNNGEDSQCNPTITNCAFIGNSASQHGGAMMSFGRDGQANPVLTNCMFIGNAAGEIGGGMYNWECQPVVINCIFRGNYALYGGGMCNEGDSIVINCSFNDNVADGRGGGMLNLHNTSPTITNCTFSTNYADQGGGGMCNDGSTNLINCTFYSNSARFNGGGIQNFAEYPGPVVSMSNCILWGNTDNDGMGESSQIYNDNTTPVVNNNCIQGWTGGLGGSGNHGDDPLFADANGIDNIAGTEDDNLRLSSTGSPCFDAGDNTAIPPDDADLDGDANTTEPTPWDLDGNPRIINGTVDMGAYELGPETETCCADFNSDLFVNFRDFAYLANQWLQQGDSLETDLIDDDKIDELDLAVFVERWLSPCYQCSEADIYTDGKIDFKDYSVLANDWLQEGPNLDGDITGDWIVNMSDLRALTLHWLNSCE